jgi:hypothetical protein
MPLPRVDIPSVGRNDNQAGPLDGAEFRLWFRDGAWPDGYAYSASVTTNYNSPLANWVGSFKNIMAPCWTAQEPSTNRRP